MLTPYGPGSKSENKDRMTLFMQDLGKLGYRKFEMLRGSWEGKTEKSVLVPNMSFSDAMSLGKKYGQDAVIYKDPSGTIGMYYRDGTAEVAVQPSGDQAAQFSTSPDLYSKARGLSFEFGVLWGQKVPWGGSEPVTRADVDRWLDEGALKVGSFYGKSVKLPGGLVATMQMDGDMVLVRVFKGEVKPTKQIYDGAWVPPGPDRLGGLDINPTFPADAFVQLQTRCARFYEASRPRRPRPA